MLPFDAYRKREEDWLCLALMRARGARMRMDRCKPSTGDYFAEDAARAMALTAAMQHYNNLRARGYELPADLASMMKQEGI